MLRRIAIAAALWLATLPEANAMSFSLRDQDTMVASGPIEEGDAAKFARLPKFQRLELDSPGGLVDEALAMAANMDARDGIRTVVKAGASCASACAMALFASGKTRIVYMGGRLGIHSCRNPDGSPALECNKTMATNAFAHGVPWGVIEGFGKYTKPSTMMWLGAEDAECWGLMKWNAEDTSIYGTDCYRWASRIPAEDVTARSAKDADYVTCRANAATSRTYVSTGRKGQGLSGAYRAACERIVADPKTPKYAAIDIIMWLTLADPNMLAIKPGTLMVNILDRDENQISNCWKCLAIVAMSEAMHGHPREALQEFRSAVKIAERDTGSAPGWLTAALIRVRPKRQSKIADQARPRSATRRAIGPARASVSGTDRDGLQATSTRARDRSGFLFHPKSLGAFAGGSAERFRQISSAWGVLSNADFRTAYDQTVRRSRSSEQTNDQGRPIINELDNLGG
jgi:hypothetical protein